LDDKDAAIYGIVLALKLIVKLNKIDFELLARGRENGG
jgi:hypothetical protein